MFSPAQFSRLRNLVMYRSKPFPLCNSITSTEVFQSQICLHFMTVRVPSVLYQTCASVLAKSGSYEHKNSTEKTFGRISTFDCICMMMWTPWVRGLLARDFVVLSNTIKKVSLSIVYSLDSVMSRHKIPPGHDDGTLFKSYDLIAECSSKDGVPREKDEINTQDLRRDMSKRKRRLVIFDKDGTIICVHKMWGPWLQEYAARLEDTTGLVFADKIFNVVGFDNNTGKFLPGGFAEGTTAENLDKIIDCISQEGVPREEAKRITHECWHAQTRDRSHNHGDVHPVGDVGSLFRVLKSKGYLIAVNTSDDRNVTEFTLDHLNIRQYVDMVVCGDDEGVLPKPHPWTAQKICSELQVEPSDVIMIGDSQSDMKLGSNAGFQCSIGVLTGITSREVLEQDAKYVVEDVHHALDLILEVSRR